MSKLDLLMERVRALPQSEQDMLADELERLLDDPGSALTPEQWAEVERELDENDGVAIANEDVFAKLAHRFGE